MDEVAEAVAVFGEGGGDAVDLAAVEGLEAAAGAGAGASTLSGAGATPACRSAAVLKNPRGAVFLNTGAS